MGWDQLADTLGGMMLGGGLGLVAGAVLWRGLDRRGRLWGIALGVLLLAVLLSYLSGPPRAPRLR